MVEQFDNTLDKANELQQELDAILEQVTEGIEDPNINQYKDALLNLSEEVTSFDDIDKFIQDAAEKGNEFLSTVEAKEKMSNKLEYIKDQINPELEKIKASIQVAPDQLTEQEKIQLADLGRKKEDDAMKALLVSMGKKIEDSLSGRGVFGEFLISLFQRLLKKAKVF